MLLFTSYFGYIIHPTFAVVAASVVQGRVMARMPAKKAVRAIWEDVLKLIWMVNEPSALGILGLRVDIFEVDRVLGPVSAEQVHLTGSFSYGDEVGSASAKLVRELFSVANFFDFERRGQHFHGGNIVNDPHLEPGSFQVVSYDKELRRAVVVSFSSPLQEGRESRFYGWQCTKGARQLAELINTMFSHLVLPEVVKIAA